MERHIDFEVGDVNGSNGKYSVDITLNVSDFDTEGGPDLSTTDRYTGKLNITIVNNHPKFGKLKLTKFN